MKAIQLPVARYRFSLRAETPIQFPAYAGSAWRGLFGTVLKRSVCVTHQPVCRDCLLWRQCVYSYIFETPPPEHPDTILRHSSAAPHPFIFRPLATSGSSFVRGQLMDIELILIGRANAHLPYIVHSMTEMGKTGITRSEGRFSIAAIQQSGTEGWQPVYDAAEGLYARAAEPLVLTTDQAVRAVRLNFVTPYRTMQQNQLVRAADFSARQLLSTLLRRVSMLQAFHTDTPLRVDFKALSELMTTVTLADNGLRWHDWTRYSNRQQTLIKMGGLLGSVVLEGEALATFLPLLQAGTAVHVGKAAVMGLGEYQLDVL